MFRFFRPDPPPLPTRVIRFGFRYLPVLAGIVCLSQSFAQRPFAGTPRIEQSLERLNTLGSVLMIAAHPDDENTALLAYFARGRHYRTAYLSLTRGEGGQNLIGPEQGDLLGVIRTQELLAARRIDGAEQFFTRAVDFGFSKTADETMEKWGREKILGDTVWVIRRFRPDVIVLRFSGTPRDGHGHHQASAILGKEAFSAAADPKRFPEQLRWVQPWQAKRLLFNVFAFTAAQEREAARLKDRLEVDTGDYSPILGYSYGEIAGMSRSMHRSQGMGSAERKGSMKNSLLVVGGEPATKDVFDGVDTTWNRVPGGAAIGEILNEAIRTFEPAHPEKTAPLLLRARPLMAAIQDPIATRKLKELDETLALGAGLWLDVSSDRYQVAPGGTVKFNITAIDRSTVPVTLTGVKLEGMEGAPALDLAAAVLADNRPSNYSMTWQIPAGQPYSGPYWLEKPKDGTTYHVDRQELIGLAENPPVLEAHFKIKMGGQQIELVRAVQHRYVDRVRGELVRPLAIVPPVAVDVPEHAFVFPNSEPRRIEIPVRAIVQGVAGELRLNAPQGWKIEPGSQPFHMALAGEQAALSFEVTPPAGDSHGELHAVAKVGEREIPVGMLAINYAHISPQTLFPPAQAELVRADIKTLATNIGYVMGAGDEVPGALRQIGCTVTPLSAEDLARGDLSRFDAIVTGVRAYNTRPDLRANQQRLLEYVKNGGALVVEYNVPEGGFGGGDSHVLDNIGPYPIQTGRERVTVEDAPVTLPNPQLAFLHAPNEITGRDFDGWVQERGLNFASEWDEHYQPIFESHDPGEQPLAGGALYTRYGKGTYIFTAYSWFRQLPAGVPGAFRIFANFLSAAKTVEQ